MEIENVFRGKLLQLSINIVYYMSIICLLKFIHWQKSSKYNMNINLITFLMNDMKIGNIAISTHRFSSLYLWTTHAFCTLISPSTYTNSIHLSLATLFHHKWWGYFIHIVLCFPSQQLTCQALVHCFVSSGRKFTTLYLYMITI